MIYIKTIIRDLSYIIANYIVANIPFWFIRKIMYKFMGMSIGKGSRICMKCIVMSPWKVTIGKNTMINEYVLLDGRGGLKIGDNCSISMWAILYTASHASGASDFAYYSNPTQIGNCCWIGTRSIVMPVSMLNEGSVLSVNSSFKGVSDTYSIYNGNPAIFVRTRGITSGYELENINFFK